VQPHFRFELLAVLSFFVRKMATRKLLFSAQICAASFENNYFFQKNFSEKIFNRQSLLTQKKVEDNLFKPNFSQ
jgi:hypothetical protein